MISIHWTFFRIISAIKAISEARTIRSYWFNIITNEAYEKSSLSYLDVSKCRLDVTHPVWASVGLKPNRDSQGVIKARLIAGSYTLQANRAAFNQYQVSGQCPLCQGDPEDRIHFILLCPELSESRDRHLRNYPCCIPRI